MQNQRMGHEFYQYVSIAARRFHVYRVLKKQIFQLFFITPANFKGALGQP